jgi:hypothetical protein
LGRGKRRRVEPLDHEVACRAREVLSIGEMRDHDPTTRARPSAAAERLARSPLYPTAARKAGQRRAGADP